MNALSEWLEVEVKRDGTLYRQRYERGQPVTKLAGVDSVGKRNTGTRVCFLPERSYFDSSSLAMGRLRHLLRAKAVLCPGLRMSLAVEAKPEENEAGYSKTDCASTSKPRWGMQTAYQLSPSYIRLPATAKPSSTH